MYTITVKDQDKQIYKAHGANVGKVATQMMSFIISKYQYNKRT